VSFHAAAAKNLDGQRKTPASGAPPANALAREILRYAQDDSKAF